MSDRVPGGAAMAHHHHHTSAGATLQPTFVGYISSTMDALVLFEGCLTGHISHVPRRPHDRERANLIRSGNVFIYEEHSSGIKRWTDGVPWSPSRILGNFLLYRELDKPFQPGEKKRAMKKTANKDSNGVTKPASNSRANSVGFSGMNMGGLASQYTDASGNNKDAERALVGSLVDSYQFKPDGLVKKTISVQYKGMQHHLVSYYNLDDVVNKKLRTPLESPELQHITPRAALISAGNFRAPVDDHELIMDDRMRLLIAQGQMMSPEINPYAAGSRSMSVPNVHHGYHQTGWPTGYPMQPNSYAVTPHTLPPPQPVSFPPPPPGYTYESSRMPTQPPNFPSMQMPSRRHSTIANNGYDTNGSGHNSYGSMPSLGRSHLSSTPVVPSSGMPSSSMIDGHGMGHGSFSGQSMYDSPAASAASSQHGAMYDSSARHAASYESSSSQHQNTSYDTQANPMFDSTSTAQATGDYESALQSQQGLGSFESPSDDNTPSALNGMDLNSSVNSAELSDGGHYSSYSGHDTGYSARGPHSQSIP
ncbi:hypothetical protein PG993_010670 [Apiospora rasikravindrae]|uniref:Uncharacterized protein n=1 Tax=Apiospora rasikravindrae TaxID=990691 RepID=A0ABR1SPR5_9PEZI